jgi:hypothetical protein
MSYTPEQMRSERAYRAVLAYSGEEQSVEENIIDLMSDLLHLAIEYGDPKDVQRIAWMHFAAERLGDNEVEAIADGEDFDHLRAMDGLPQRP